MFLYIKNDDIINIYSLEGKKRALKNYRKSIIESIGIDNLFYTFETSNQYLFERFINSEEIDINELNKADKSNNHSDWYSKLTIDERKYYNVNDKKEKEQQKVLNEYINGDSSYELPTRTYISTDNIKCNFHIFLPTKHQTEEFSKIENRPIYRLENIIKLTPELFAIQALEKGRFDLIDELNIDLDSLMRLFKLEKVNSFNINDKENEWVLENIKWFNEAENSVKVFSKLK